MYYFPNSYREAMLASGRNKYSDFFDPITNVSLFQQRFIDSMWAPGEPNGFNLSQWFMAASWQNTTQSNPIVDAPENAWINGYKTVLVCVKEPPLCKTYIQLHTYT